MNEGYANIFKDTIKSEIIEQLISETEQLIDAGLIASAGINCKYLFGKI